MIMQRLQEIVTRRYKNPLEIPDLILIDGGKGTTQCDTSNHYPHQLKL